MPPRIAVIDYGIGNLHSAQKGFAHVGADSILTADPEEIANADGVVLPGVGAFASCMNALERTGLDKVVLETIAAGKPFFGICVGMQVLFSASEEAPGVAGLGVFPQQVRWLSDSVKRPQMQWNILRAKDPMFAGHPMFAGLAPEPWMYFVHSLAPEIGPEAIADCEYGGSVCAAVARDRLWAVQFHPEKSTKAGLQVLSNFVNSTASR